MCWEIIKAGMTADREFLKRLEYTSSEDEFLDYDNSKENSFNLNKRKSKMGKLSNTTPVKQDRRGKRKSVPAAKVDEKGKDRRRTRSSASTTKALDNNILKETRKIAAIQPTAFITTRRLTTGISGIFSNSKASDVVKRPGRRRAIDLSRRQMPMEIQQQVHRDLERILKQPSFVIQHSVIMDNSDETYGPSPSICEKASGNIHSHRRMASGSSSITSQSLQNVRTPHTKLSVEIPFEDISRRLKESLIIADFFPGKSYLDELREDLRKVVKQHVSILKNEDSCTVSETPAVCRAGVIPISVSRRTRKIEAQFPPDIADHQQTDAMLNDDLKNPMATSGKDNSMTIAEPNPISILGHASHSDCMHRNQFHPTACYDDNHSNNSLDISRQQMAKDKQIQECHPRIQVSEMQPSGLPCHPGIHRFGDSIEGERRFSSTVVFDRAQFCQQLDLNQCHNQLQSLQQREDLQQQDSGAFSFEYATRGQRNKNNNRSSFHAKNHCIKRYSPHFYPQRQGGALRNDTGFASIESSYNRYIDHNYATNSNNFDILHYAGEINDDCEMDDIETNDERTKTLSSCINLRKKPCADTPTSPFKLYRMKMF